MKTHLHLLRFALVSAGLLLALQACGSAPPVTPPITAIIGAAGGTLSTSSGATVVIPPGALTGDITIGIEQSSLGAPPLPGGFTTVGQMFAFTPHGQSFAAPVTITLPFNPASVPAGSTPELYKNNAQNQWEPVVGATFGSSSVSGSVTSFSYPVVVIPPLERFPPYRKWSFTELRGEYADPVRVAPVDPDPDEQEGGLLYDPHNYNATAADEINLELPTRFLEEFPPDGRAFGEVFGSESGKTYSAYAESANGGANSLVGTETFLTQEQTFIKRASNAKLTFTVSSIVLIAKDEEAVVPTRGCPPTFVRGLACDVLRSEVTLIVTAKKKGEPVRFWGANSGVRLYGAKETKTPKDWELEAWNDSLPGLVPLWQETDFTDAVSSTEGIGGGQIVVQLSGSRTYNVDLSSVGKDEEFTLTSSIFATAQNRNAYLISEGGDTYAAAYLRDPQKLGGTVLTMSGLEAVRTTGISPSAIEVPVQPAPCVSGPSPDPAAGTIQFGAPAFTTSEGETVTLVTVSRTGGSKGAVTATIRTSDGSARAGTDYTAMNQSVFFGDGDDTERIVRVSLITNTAFNEPDKTLNLTLSQPGGCGALGAQSSTVLTIRDDDEPPPPPTFTVGGTVAGLVGTGLVLRDHKFLDITPSNGAFTFPQPTTTGLPYAVTIVSQPTNPIQTCSVTNGTGLISNANITNIAVDCVTPTVNGALDSNFGDGGKAFTAFGGDESALALQADGKVVMVGGNPADFTLARYTSAGRLDSSFGSAGTGTVTTDIATGNDEARGVAIQSDGKIVVVGSAVVGRTANNNFNFDFAVARYNADGTPDNSFSGDGKVTTDFNLLADTANAVAIQSDGKIVVVGSAALTNPGFADFALARYNPDGTLDSSFDGDGKVTTAIGARVDFARNVVVLANQNILVSGFSEVNARDGTGLARYTSSGALDTSFGGGGKTSVPEHRLEEGLAVQSDGKIVIAGNVNVGVFPSGSSQFGVMRFGANGSPDSGFGTAGLVTLAFTALNDFGRAIALQADGKIVVAGQSSNNVNPDFGIARFNTDGTPDGSFGTGGKLSFSFFNAGDGAESVVVQPDGKIVVGGFATSGTQFGYGLARVNP
jgi:uncharacterized delta-60 repeat protein